MDAEIITGGEATAADTGESTAVEDTAQVVDTGAVDDAAQDTAQDSDVAVDDAAGAPVGDVASKIRAHVESLKKTDPALAKEIKNLSFSQQAFKAEVPGGLPEVRKLKEVVEQIGGVEGVERIRTERAEWADIDSKFAAGDPAVLKTFREQNPEGYAKLIPAALDDLANVNRDVYNRTMAGPFVATLDAWRFGDIDDIAATIASVVDDKQNPLLAREARALQQMAAQYKAVKKLATEAPPKPEVDPEKQKLATERASLAKEKEQITAQHVGSATQDHAVKQYQSFLPTEARNQKLNIEGLKAVDYGNGEGTAYDRFMREIDSEVGQMIGGDKDAVAKINASIAAGRRDEAVKLSNSKFDAVYQKAIQKVVRRWASTFNPTAKPKAGLTTNAAVAGTSKPSPAGVKKLNAAPDTSQVDQSVAGWREDYMFGKARLKSGQRVEW